MPLSHLSRTLQSQFQIARLNHPLWSFRHILGGLRLAQKWFLHPDGTAPPPLALAWYLTHACPEKCDFCNVSRALKTAQPHLRFKDARPLIDALIPTIPVVALGGGEPMAHPDVIDIIRHIHTRNGRVFIVTSGTPIGPSLARELARSNPEMIMISLLGPEPIHDQRMGRTGAFKRTLAAIENIQQHRDPRKSRLIINCAISPSETEILPDVVRIAKDLGVDALRFSWLSFMNPTEQSTLPIAEPYFILPEEEIRAFDLDLLWNTVHKLQREEAPFVQFLPRLSKSEFQAWFHGSGVERACLSLWHTLFLRPDAVVVPCGHMQNQELGNLRQHPLDDIWNHQAFKTLRIQQRQKPFQMCKRCCKV